MRYESKIRTFLIFHSALNTFQMISFGCLSYYGKINLLQNVCEVMSLTAVQHM